MKRYTGIFVLLALGIGWLLPAGGHALGPWLQPMLMLLMFLSCLDVRVRRTLAALRQWRSIGSLLVIIHFVSPLLVLLARPLLPPDVFLGFILAAAMSSGMAVVFLAQVFGGDSSRALVVTTFSQVASPVVVPLVTLALAGTAVAIDPWAMAETIAKLVLLPIAAAVAVRKLNIDAWPRRVATPVSQLLLVLLIIGVIAPVRSTILAYPGMALAIGAGVLAVVLINVFLGYHVGQTRQERITASIVAGYKNYTLATVVALSLFGPLAALPSIMYTVIDNLLLLPGQWWWGMRRK